MNDDTIFEYLLNMGAMRPEQDELKRKQAMVDALRQNALSPMKGEMVGKHYVGPGVGGLISQLGQGYLAAQQQRGVDDSMKTYNDKQRQMLEEMRRRRMGQQPTQQAPAMDMSYDTSTFGGNAY